MPYYTYFLKSLKDGKYYYGHSSDIEKRVQEHNSNRVRSTKSRTPLTLHYYEILENKSAAYRRELFFKSAKGKIFLRGKNIID